MRKSIVVCVINLLIIITFSGCIDEISHPDVRTIYVDDDGGQDYTTIQGAIDNASEGDTIYVNSGVYREAYIDIRKPILLQGEDKETTIIQRPENNTDTLVYVYSKAHGLKINGFTFNNTISGHRGSECLHIYSDNNVISNNKFISADFADILLNGALNNVITNNSFTSNGILVRVSGTPFLEMWNTHTIENNYISGKPLIYIKDNHEGGIISSDYGQVILANCTNFTIENLNLENVYCSIQLAYSSYNNILNNTIVNLNKNGVGIHLRTCKFNRISGNKVYNCWEGIEFAEYSSDNFIENNIFSGNHNGIYQYGFSNNDRFINNTILDNDFAGIYLDSFSYENIVSNNQILNSKFGIILAIMSDNNTISNNNIVNNSRYGISIEDSTNNMLFHNNFINNSINAKLDEDRINNWDNGFEGNYWDDYIGIDVNGDGIGDTVVEIPAGRGVDNIPSIYNFDNYPLMYPVDIS